MQSDKTILVGVSDVFFYTKIRDAFRPRGFALERLRRPEDLADRVSALHPIAMIVNMNDDRLDAPQLLRTLRTHHDGCTLPVLAFANHEEVDTWRQAKELGVQKIVSRNEFSARTLALMEELLGQPGNPS